MQMKDWTASELRYEVKLRTETSRAVSVKDVLKYVVYPPFAWPGGYNIFYVTQQNAALCSACAAKNGQHGNDPVIGMDVNYEDTSLYCYDCAERIESAYGEENDSQQEG